MSARKVRFLTTIHDKEQMFHRDTKHDLEPDRAEAFVKQGVAEYATPEPVEALPAVVKPAETAASKPKGAK